MAVVVGSCRAGAPTHPCASVTGMGATERPTPTRASVEQGQCTMDGECQHLLAICTHMSAHNRPQCVRPWVNGEHRPGFCSAVTCEADSQSECERLVQRCGGAPGR